MVDRQTIAFRCDASPKIGSGHVMRCLTLAAELTKRGDVVSFLCTEETLQTVSALQNSPYKIIHDDTINHTDWLIIDHYNLDAKYEKEARSWAKNIFVIDDLANRQHDCDFLLDQTYRRKDDDYSALVPNDSVLLIGTDYALLREEFSVESTTRVFNSNRILVSYGGVNPKSCTQKTLSMLADYNKKPLIIDVVVGSNAHGLDEIKSMVKNINEKGFHAAHLHMDTTEISKLMISADLCLGAGGTTSWERCCLGLPTLALELADNQEPTLRALDDAGAIINLGKIENLTHEKFLDQFSHLVSAPNKLQKLSQNSMKICDGRGAERVAASIIPAETAKDGKPVRLRAASSSDLKTVFEWQCTPGVRQHARNPELPTWEGHQAWFTASLQNIDRRMFIILYDSLPAGFARLDREGDGHFEVSILISPVFQGKGLGVSALKLLRSAEPFAIFRAEILPNNNISHKMFTRAGYETLNNGWYISNPAA